MTKPFILGTSLLKAYELNSCFLAYVSSAILAVK
nr:MAG TPA: hypothetical protein [Caudoviricetes sp.]